MRSLPTEIPPLSTTEIHELRQIIPSNIEWSPDIETQGLNFGGHPYSDLNRILLRTALKKHEQQQESDDQSNILQISKTSKIINHTQSKLPQPYWESAKTISKIDGKILLSDDVRKLADQGKPIIDPKEVLIKKRKEKPDTLSSHFDLPKTKITPELKRDLQLIHMRDVQDPKRMYKKQGPFQIPGYSQVGTYIEGPSEFFSSRLSKSERSNTLLEESLTNESQSGKLRSRYNTLNTQQRKGKKAYYRSITSQRKKQR